MFDVVPTFAREGVPLSAPVVGSKAAHAGRFAIVKVTEVAAESTDGWKAYGVPATTVVAGDPCTLSGAAVVDTGVVVPEPDVVAPEEPEELVEPAAATADETPPTGTD